MVALSARRDAVRKDARVIRGCDRDGRVRGGAFWVAGMTRQTTFSFTLDPTPEQRVALGRHVGAARFAFNQCLRLVLNALGAKKDQPEGRVPWSGFDLINAFNAWKRSPEAGLDAE